MLKVLPLADRFVLSEVVLAESDWWEWHAVARYRISTRLFAKDDIVFCFFGNGQGHRCNVCGYSSKFGKICNSLYGKYIYATYARLGGFSNYKKTWNEDYYNKAQLVFIVPPEVTLPFGRYEGRDHPPPSFSMTLLPEVRAMLLESLCTDVSALSVGASSRQIQEV
jgi:hypothetical protein